MVAKRVVMLSLVGLVLMGLSVRSMADMRGSELADAPILKVAFSVWEPFRILDEGVLKGIDIDLLNLLSQQHGFKIHYIHCPWARCLLMMQTGELDLMTGIALREERAKYIQYLSPPYYNCRTRFYMRKGEEARLQVGADLYPLRIGMVRASAYYSEFDTDTRLNKHIVTQESTLLPLLEAKRIDTYIGTDCQADYELSLSRWHGLFVKAPFKPKSNTLLYVGVSKQSRWLQHEAQLSQSIQQIINNGFFSQVQHQYYQPVQPN